MGYAARPMHIRTRFAPSPTGYLHLGSARTALFNWAFARHAGGCFLLRIEDTDRERSTPESERAVLDALAFLGLDCDEEPWRQSERRAQHEAAIGRLLDEGKAYRCVCTREELEARRAAADGRRTYDGRCRDRGLGPDCGVHTVRLRLAADADLGWDDLVFGPSGQEALQIGDMILQRSDGSPLYNLAVVVDDIDMQITHVIRGADHQPNTSLQIAIYRALDATPPKFAHVPLIVSASGKKLSKRRDPVSIQDFESQGYLADALCNWMLRLGWSHGDEEIFSRDEMRQKFGLDAIGRSGAQADVVKLGWLNQHYLKALPIEELLRALDPHLEAIAGVPAPRDPGFARLLDLLRERSTTLKEMAEKSAFAAVDSIEIEEKAARKHLVPATLPLLEALGSALAELPDWNVGNLEAAFEQVRSRFGDLKIGRLAQPVRVAVTGTTVSPGIFETLEALGAERTCARIGAATDAIRRNTPGA